MPTTNPDAVVVGSGPNGLAAAIALQQQGVRVLLLEAKDSIGGGMRTSPLTLPGFLHDVCSAVHPLAVASPFFRSLPLEKHGLYWLQPPVAAAHPLDNGPAAVLLQSMEETAQLLGADAAAYRQLMGPLVHDWPLLVDDVLAPLRLPAHPTVMARFGMKALASALRVSQRFHTQSGKALWAGMAAHSLMPLEDAATAAAGLVLMTAGHTGGWPIPKGGSQSIADALAAYFVSLGGTIETNVPIRSLQQLPPARAVLLDVTPRQLLDIAGQRLSALYRWQLERYRYGMGVFKIDWALDAPIPFSDAQCRQAGTVHIGGTLEEIAFSEGSCWQGLHVDQPFVLLAQPSVTDPSRAPAGRHVAWAYCHVPNGSTEDRTAAIEAQVERFAPGFRERILARHTMHTAALEEYNPNYIGGDINGGAFELSQIFTRPALRFSPYRTSAKGIYLCSSSTPPGGGVHGMCGYHAARRALKDVFGIS
ncbi:MAG: NAD(P)/FAD-dependent oxidoreductase [Bacteroidetes bacterium]|nr:NAD(P)/FAD-dependent oxidoreductase [Bacteroidota bacterium]